MHAFCGLFLLWRAIAALASAGFSSCIPCPASCGRRNPFPGLHHLPLLLRRPQRYWRRPEDAGIHFPDSTTCPCFCGVHRSTGGVLGTPKSISGTPPLSSASAASTEVLPRVLWTPESISRTSPLAKASAASTEVLPASCGRANSLPGRRRKFLPLQEPICASAPSLLFTCLHLDRSPIVV